MLIVYLVKFMHLGEQCEYHRTENSALLFFGENGIVLDGGYPIKA